MPMFHSSNPRREYALLLVAALLYGSTNCQLIILAVVLRPAGFTDPEIGAVMSSMNGAMVLAALGCGTLAARLGAVHTLVLGGVLSLAAVIALPFTMASVPLAMLAMAGRGIGFGLFTPAGQLVAKTLAGEADQIRAVGMFTACFLIPNLVGPAVGVWALDRWGPSGYFVLAALPLLGSVALVTALPRHRDTRAPATAAGYLGVLRDRRVWLPNLTGMQSGLAYVFAQSWLPLLFVTQGTPVAAFFTPFAVVLLGTRFVGLAYLQQLAPPTLAALGLAAYAVGLGVLAVTALLPGALVAGGLFGLGYAIIHPTCVEWASRDYPPAERARPVALINTTFHIGAMLSVQFTGVALTALGWPGILSLLATVVCVVLVIGLVAELLRKRDGAVRVSLDHQP
jgi:predicted MFS family arabinose efflux permease